MYACYVMRLYIKKGINRLDMSLIACRKHFLLVLVCLYVIKQSVHIARH